ncbi:CHAT domain-containing protein [Methylobacterium sp. NMS12]|uniref:CHAT domain-containing protein n=1 Tax=Methylobacterium sp. NMS12 TaxID=3079766 RepID=UPI003F883C9D
MLHRRDLLLEALQELSDQVAEGWDIIGEEVQARTLRALEDAGDHMAHALLGEKQGAFIAAVQAHSAAARMIVTSFDTTLWLPWDFLRFKLRDERVYLGSLLTISPDWFSSDDGCYSAEYPVTQVRPRVGLIEDSLLLSSRARSPSEEREISALSQIVSNVSEIDVLHPLNDRLPRPAEIKRLNSFIGEMRRVLHLNCHGTAGRGRTQKIRIADAFEVSTDDLRTRFDLNGALATLNVCNSGRAKYDSSDTLSQLLHYQNAAAVVCTTGKVSDAFGTLFAHELYRRLATEDLLSSIDGARKALASVAGHPMSLMYTFSGKAAFRVPYV